MFSAEPRLHNTHTHCRKNVNQKTPPPEKMVVSHMRYSVMWCLRYGVVARVFRSESMCVLCCVCVYIVLWCVCVCVLCVHNWGCIEGGRGGGPVTRGLSVSVSVSLSLSKMHNRKSNCSAVYLCLLYAVCRQGGRAAVPMEHHLTARGCGAGGRCADGRHSSRCRWPPRPSPHQSRT